jgi:hypothetical protein
MSTIRKLLLGLSFVASAACANDQDRSAAATVTNDQQAQTPAVAASAEMVVHKNASCGCCGKWVEHMQHSGFDVTSKNVDNLGPIKERVGVPHGMGSCHTAEVAGYFIEGHVPADAVKRLLAEKPKAKGLTVPGMPIGSPGMESGDRLDPYEVHLVHEDGTTSVFERYE